MEKLYFLLTVCAVSFVLQTCATTDTAISAPPAEPATGTVAEPVAPPVAPPQVQEQPAEPDPIPVAEEYSRSVGSLQQVSVDTFKNDKSDILSTINQLAIIMETEDYKNWLRYVSPESISYWSNTRNLAAVSGRLPVKGVKLRSLEDYFKWVFIPSRRNRSNDQYEIRYMGTTRVKAVKMQNNEDIIFYTFVKQDNKWLLYLDTL